MKIKKHTKILSVLLSLMLSLTVNVDALGVDANKCKDGVVYTNYYYLLDANTFTGAAITEAGGVYNFMQSYTHTTQGVYTNNIILIDGLKSTGFQNVDSDKYYVEKGSIKVTTSPTSGLSNINIDDFYDTFYEAADKSNGSWTESDGVTSRIVAHAYRRVSSSGDVGETIDSALKVVEASKSDLIDASVKLGNYPEITYVELTSSDDFANDITLQIARSYANPSSYKESSFSDITPVELEGKTWYLQPAVYFIQYCEKGNGASETKTVSYDANAGNDTVANKPTDTTTNLEECDKISSNNLVRSGYKFLGWSESADATTPDTKYAPGSDYCEQRSIKLYAVWEKNSDSFTVTYNANGGKDAPAAQSGTSGECVTISSSKPILAKNNFLGWSTDPNAKEPDENYAAGQQYCGANGDITLYAVWQTQTGVSAHVIAFGIVAIGAIAALIVAKKKDLLKQI